MSERHDGSILSWCRGSRLNGTPQLPFDSSFVGVSTVAGASKGPTTAGVSRNYTGPPKSHLWSITTTKSARRCFMNAFRKRFLSDPVIDRPGVVAPVA